MAKDADTNGSPGDNYKYHNLLQKLPELTLGFFLLAKLDRFYHIPKIS